MRYIDAVRGSLIAAVCLAGGAFAQTPTSVTPTAVMTDTAPAPAEERDSVGAVLIETSMVRAHRMAFGTRSTPEQVQAIGQGVMRATLAAQQAKDRDEGPNTRALGGPPAPADRTPTLKP
jgi:hypothetical protein